MKFDSYGFTDEELDFIVNYDVKYRMGGDATEEDDGAAASQERARLTGEAPACRAQIGKRGAGGPVCRTGLIRRSGP